MSPCRFPQCRHGRRLSGRGYCVHHDPDWVVAEIFAEREEGEYWGVSARWKFYGDGLDEDGSYEPEGI